MQINFQKINPQQNISLSVQQRKNPTFGNIFNDEEDIFTSAEYTIIELADIVIKLIHEKHIEKYIKIFQNKRYKAALNYLRNRKIEDLGKKRLAYEVKGHSEGHYYIIQCSMESEKMSELERIYRITDEILKFITVKKD